MSYKPLLSHHNRMRAPRRSPVLLDASISMRVTTVGGEGKSLRGYGISGREHQTVFTDSESSTTAR